MPVLTPRAVLHHLVIRGIERRLIFRDDVDKDRFVARMGIPTSGHPALMGEIVRPWQDARCPLLNFGAARQRHLSFMENRSARGKRPDLTGGGLTRGCGSWTEVRKEGQRIKGDERIPGESAFVQGILSHAEERLRGPQGSHSGRTYRKERGANATRPRRQVMML